MWEGRFRGVEERAGGDRGGSGRDEIGRWLNIARGNGAGVREVRLRGIGRVEGEHRCREERWIYIIKRCWMEILPVVPTVFFLFVSKIPTPGSSGSWDRKARYICGLRGSWMVSFFSRRKKTGRLSELPGSWGHTLLLAVAVPLPDPPP